MSKKLSYQFEYRLDQYDPDTVVRAIVVLHRNRVAVPASRSLNRGERMAKLKNRKQTMSLAFSQVKKTVTALNGRVLRKPDALGNVYVELMPSAIKSLANSEWVDAIMEDQKIDPIK